MTDDELQAAEKLAHALNIDGGTSGEYKEHVVLSLVAEVRRLKQDFNETEE